MSTILEYSHVTKQFGSMYALSDVSLTIEPGHIIGLLGPNGAGKTTTLRCISTIIRPTKGEIYVAGHEVQK